jgi:hypothetical protein
MNEGAPTGDIPEPQQPDQAAEALDQPDVAAASMADEGVAQSDTNSGDSSEQPSVPQEDTNPGAPQVDGANYLKGEGGEAKAETMAYAEKEFRDKAAHNRGLSEYSEELTEKSSERIALRNQLSAAPQQFSGIQRLRMKRRYGKLRGEEADLWDQEVEERHVGDIKARAEFERDFSPERQAHDEEIHQLIANQPETRAAYYDKLASRIGDWAGILHDHPLGEAFLKSHSVIPADPEAAAKRLVHLENNAAALERIIAREEQTGRSTLPQEINAALGIDSSNDHAGTVRQNRELQSLLQVASEDEVTRYEDGVNQLRSAALYLSRLHNSLYDTYDLQPLREEVALIHSILKDVKNEVGLPEDQEPEAATEELVQDQELEVQAPQQDT